MIIVINLSCFCFPEICLLLWENGVGTVSRLVLIFLSVSCFFGDIVFFFPAWNTSWSFALAWMEKLNIQVGQNRNFAFPRGQQKVKKNILKLKIPYHLQDNSEDRFSLEQISKAFSWYYCKPKKGQRKNKKITTILYRNFTFLLCASSLVD